MIFYDFEVFSHDWLLVCANSTEKKETVIINNVEELREYYEKNKNEIWVGYNSKHYDQYILKGLMLGMNPKIINDKMIVDGKKGYEISREFNKIQLFNYDVMNRGDPSLKTLEGFMGNNIKESSVDFNIDRKLTKYEISDVVKYCKYDVEQTIEVFLRRTSEFESHISLSKVANNGVLKLSHLHRTKTQLSSILLDAQRKNFETSDEFDLIIPDNIKISKYKGCVDWYKDPINHCYKKKVRGKSGKIIVKDSQLDIMIAGVPHILGYGGIHGAIKKYQGIGKYVLMDVTSLYPTLMIEYNLLSRTVKHPEKFKKIYQKNLDLKAANQKAKREPYKLTCNSTYGAMKDKYNNLYDPRMANNVCIHGQLFLVDLIEHLEPHCQIIQSNTDGILVKYNDFSKIEAVTNEWMSRTHLTLDFDFFTKIYQKDVNNYIFVDESGNATTKGAFVKKLNDLDNDLPIVNLAINKYLVDNIPVEDTINKATCLKDFQMIKRITNKFNHLKHGDTILSERCVRVFASKRPNDGGLFQQNKRTNSYGKVTNSPDKCFIENSDVNTINVPRYLDRQFYIDLAKHRLNLFGVNI